MKNQTKETAHGMHIKEETDTKIVLEWVQWSDNLGYIFPLLLVVSGLMFGLVKAFDFFSGGSYSWLYWVIALLVLVVEFFIIRTLFHFIKTEIVSVDFDSLTADRVEKLLSVKIKQSKFDLRQVSRVLINMEEHGHHHRLYLESPNKKPFQVSIAFATGPYDANKLIGHGRKIGKLLSKPVVFKHTDLGNLISENRI